MSHKNTIIKKIIDDPSISVVAKPTEITFKSKFETILNMFPVSNSWTEEIISKKFVHKSDVNNVLITTGLRCASNASLFRTKVIIDVRHQFFFDHAMNHVPGMLIVEAARQFGTAIPHFYYDVPFDSKFVMNTLNIKFVSLANLLDSTLIDVSIKNEEYKKSVLRRVEADVFVHQNNRLIATLYSHWTIMPIALFERLSDTG